jgi:hypothetical protein
MSSATEMLEVGDKLQWLAEHGIVEVNHSVVPNPAPGDLRKILWTVKFQSLDGLSFNYISEWDLGLCVSRMMEVIQKRLRRSW